jgi:hypothetical protein
MAGVTIGPNTIHLPITAFDPFTTSQTASGLLRAGNTEAVRRGRHRYTTTLAAWFVLQTILANPQSLIFRPAAMGEQLALSRQRVPTEMTKGGWHGSIDLRYT